MALTKEMLFADPSYRRLRRSDFDKGVRVHELEHLVQRLMQEIQALHRAKDDLWDHLKANLEIRRIAAVHGIPQKEVFAAFERWLKTQDFADLRGRYRRGAS